MRTELIVVLIVTMIELAFLLPVIILLILANQELQEQLATKSQEYQWLKEMADFWKKGGHFEKPVTVEEYQV